MDNTYFDLLINESDEEKKLNEERSEELRAFENTPMYQEHRARIKEIGHRQNMALKKRLDKAKQLRLKRIPLLPKSHTMTQDELLKHKEERQKNREAEIESLPENLRSVIKGFVNLSDKEKTKVLQMVRPSLPIEDLDDLENPVTKENDIQRLQEVLVQTCIEFINEYNLADIDAVRFSVDGLKTSSKYRSWTPNSDSSIIVEGLGSEKTEEGFDFTVRKLIGKYY